MSVEILLSVITDNYNGITKTISLEDGKLKKKANASITDGTVIKIGFDSWEEFRGYLDRLASNQCLVLGKFKYKTPANIVPKVLEEIEIGNYSKTLDNFEWHQEYQLLCIDHDGSMNDDLTPDEVITAIDEVLPGFAKVKKVVKYSSSACVFSKDNELVSKNNAFHIYFIVNKPEKIENIFKGSSSFLHRKLWNNGHGYIKNSNPKNRKTTTVNQFERTIYDNVIFSSERIIFEANPILNDGLFKKNIEAFVVDGDLDYLDIGQFGTLTDIEIENYKQLVNEAKIENEKTSYMIESRNIFENHVKEKILNGAYKNRSEYKNLGENEIIEKEYNLSKKLILLNDHEIFLENGRAITVAEIIANPDLFHGKHCKDPHEPDYGNSNIATIYLDQAIPVIYSHAHGGITYTLKQVNNIANFSSIDFCMEHFHLCVADKKNEIYYINGNKIEVYSEKGFENLLSGYYVEKEINGKKTKIPIKNYWMSRTDKKFIKPDGFDPSKPIVYEKYGDLYLNDFVPEILKHNFDELNINEIEEYSKPFVNHIYSLIYDREDAEVILDYLSYIFKCPSERPSFSVVITSKEKGVGKSIIVEILGYLLGTKYSKIVKTLSELLNPKAWGNLWHKTMLITIDECGDDEYSYKVDNNLKELVTAPSMGLNIKHKDIIDTNVYAALIFFSNHEYFFKLEDGDRRFFVTRCDWTTEDIERNEKEKYYYNLINYYKNEPLHQFGLFTYLKNREIKINLKGHAPLNEMKKIIMKSGKNDVENFFISMMEHPCQYWTTSMIKDLFIKKFGEDSSNLEKQFKYHINKMFDAGRAKGGQRIKAFTLPLAQQASKYKIDNIEMNWEITTNDLYKNSKQFDDYIDVSCKHDSEINEYDISNDLFNFNDTSFSDQVIN